MKKTKKKMKQYNTRTWLNPPKLSASGSIICYSGPSAFFPNSRDNFVEISSCHETARIHRTDDSTLQEYIDKISLLCSELEQYVKFLKKLKDDKTITKNEEYEKRK